MEDYPGLVILGVLLVAFYLWLGNYSAEQESKAKNDINNRINSMYEYINETAAKEQFKNTEYIVKE